VKPPPDKNGFVFYTTCEMGVFSDDPPMPDVSFLSGSRKKSKKNKMFKLTKSVGPNLGPDYSPSSKGRNVNINIKLTKQQSQMSPESKQFNHMDDITEVNEIASPMPTFKRTESKDDLSQNQESGFKFLKGKKNLGFGDVMRNKLKKKISFI
jgi:hypothetical protein